MQNPNQKIKGEEINKRKYENRGKTVKGAEIKRRSGFKVIDPKPEHWFPG